MINRKHAFTFLREVNTWWFYKRINLSIHSLTIEKTNKKPDV